MKIDFGLGGGLFDTLEIMTTRAENLAPPMRAWVKEKREEVKEIFANQGFVPLAASTLKKREQTGTSRITKHGKVRASVKAALENRLKRIKAKYAAERAVANKRFLGRYRSFEKTEDLTKKFAAYDRAIQRLEQQLQRSADKDYGSRKTGISAQARRNKQGRGNQILGRLPSSITHKLYTKGANATAILRSRAGVIGQVHNEGDGHNPERRYLELTSRDVERCAYHFTQHGLAPLRGDT